MKSAPGVTSSSERSKAARARGGSARAIASGDGIHERALDGNLDVRHLARAQRLRTANVEDRARGGAHVDERVASAIFDIDHLSGNRVERAGIADRGFLRAYGDASALSGQRELARPDETDAGPGKRDAIAFLARNVELEHVAVSHEARDVQVRRLQIDVLRR